MLSVSLRKKADDLFLGGITQDSADGSAPDVKPASDLRLGDASAMQSPDLGRVRGCRCWPAQTLAVLPGVGQASPSSFPQNLPFKLGEYG